MIKDPLGHNGGSPWGASPEQWQPQRKWAPRGTVVLFLSRWSGRG